MSVIASVLAAAQDVNVKILDDGRSGLSLRDFVIPIGALIAGVGGVLIGGKIQHGIEDKRSGREEDLDERRADRERALEDERQRRADNADKRRAIGSIRISRGYMMAVRVYTGFALKHRVKWPIHETLDPPTPLDEQAHLMASWLSREGWASFSSFTARLHVQRSTDIASKPPTAAWCRQVANIYEGATEVIMTLRAEEARLAHEIGELSDPADARWEPLPEITWPEIKDSDEDPAVSGADPVRDTRST